MSVTGHSDVRHDDDFYRTPAWATRAILRELSSPRGPFHDRPPVRVLDPGCGDGAIAQVVKEHWPECMVVGVDIDEERLRAARPYLHGYEVGDFLDFTWGDVRFDLSLGNPPFSLAQPFIVRAASMANIVVKLLRQNFCASMERVPFHRAHPSDLHVLPRRPQFAKVVHCVGKGRKPKDGCGWHVMIRVEDTAPKRCPSCDGKRASNSSDSTEYAWFAFGAGRGGHWSILDVDDEPGDRQ